MVKGTKTLILMTQIVLAHAVHSNTSNSYLWGIDVSHYQGSIDWSAVAASGIDFAMVRVCSFRRFCNDAASVIMRNTIFCLISFAALYD